MQLFPENVDGIFKKIFLPFDAHKVSDRFRIWSWSVYHYRMSYFTVLGTRKFYFKHKPSCQFRPSNIPWAAKVNFSIDYLPSRWRHRIVADSSFADYRCNIYCETHISRRQLCAYSFVLSSSSVLHFAWAMVLHLSLNPTASLRYQ